MAVNTSRSQNADLRLGATDGKYSNLTPDRGGNVEMDAVKERAALVTPKYNSFDVHGHSCNCNHCTQ